jgi:hypothetical protein
MQQASRQGLLLIMAIPGHDSSNCCCVEMSRQPPKIAKHNNKGNKLNNQPLSTPQSFPHILPEAIPVAKLGA